MNKNNFKFLTAIFAIAALWFPVAHSQNIPTQIATLQAQVAALQTQVTALQKALALVQSNDATAASNLQARLTVIENNHALLLGRFVRVDENTEVGVIGPNIVFTGANIHIVSGSGFTADGSGLGNLIVGYNESPVNTTLFNPRTQTTGDTLLTGDRRGSHNHVLGRFNKFTSFGGLVSGEDNTISGDNPDRAGRRVQFFDG
jgi:hypothetical protein